MTDQFNRQVIKVSVAQTCQAVGWSSIQTTPLELLTDLVQSYVKRLSRLSSSYANFYGQSEPNLDHVALAFRDMGINVNDLQDYVTYVDNNNVLELPMYPLPKESHLNLLKPGSREVVTRPVHIHEHLPPMHPHLEEPEYPMKASPTSNENSTAEVPVNARGVFKRPLDVSQETVSRRIRLLPEEEVRPLREISSVMMTTSGFLSHAREGKLPESRSIPPIEEDTDDSPQEEPSSDREKNVAPAPSVAAESKPERKKKNKSSDLGKKVDKENKNKDDMNDSARDEDVPKVKKLAGVKETNKLKALKTGAVKLHSGVNDKKNEKKKKRVASPGSAPIGRPRKSPKVEKPRSPMYREISASDDQNSVSDVKLPSEPDKQKLNIFKKISKVKEEHEEIKVDVTDDAGPKHGHPNDTVDRSHHSKVIEAVKKHDTDEDSLIFGGRNSPLCTDDLAFMDDPSRPGTPATPKTPDLPRVTEHKKKKKDKHREKKEQEKYVSSPRSSKSDEFLSKPKTPEVDITGSDDPLTPPFPFYPNVSFPPGPGLIPPPFSHPLIPHQSLLLGPYPRIPAPTTPFPSKLTHPPPKEKEPPQILNIGPGGIQIPNGITLTPVPPPVTTSQEPAAFGSSKPNPVKKKDKKDKKNKDKTKKKKDKKEKYKAKEKSEKKKIKLGKKEKDKLKSKKEKKEKKKEKEVTDGKKDDSSPALPKITLKLGPASPQDPVTENLHRKIVIKPLIKKEEDLEPFSKVTTPESSKSSKKSHHSKKTEPPQDIFRGYGSHSTSQNIVHQMTYDVNDVKIEGDPNQVWICPACQRPDDGSPMIACDLCDNWFHWICVGIQEAIDGDWYCRECRIKKEEEAANEKKKKHKKKK